LAKSKFDSDKATLTFNFDSVEDANNFKSWLCGSGEQHFWTWEEYRLQEADDQDASNLSKFDYWNKETSVINVTRK
jgi:hypothetical protein